MTQSITTKLSKKCIQLYNNVELWVDAQIADQIAKDLDQKDKVIKINNQIFRMSQIYGIYDEETMKEVQLKKNGYWKCDYGTWHSKNETCSCSMSLKNRVIKEESVNVNKGRRLTGLEKWGKTKLPESIINKYKGLTN